MGLISKNKNKKQESNKSNTKQKQIQKNKAIMAVCSAGMKFCSRVEACFLSLSLIMLRRVGGLEWPWVRDSLAYGDRDVCVRRVVDYSSLVMHGRIPLY